MKINNFLSWKMPQVSLGAYQIATECDKEISEGY
jgi:hypothetical protein